MHGEQIGTHATIALLNESGHIYIPESNTFPRVERIEYTPRGSTVVRKKTFETSASIRSTEFAKGSTRLLTALGVRYSDGYVFLFKSDKPTPEEPDTDALSTERSPWVELDQAVEIVNPNSRRKLLADIMTIHAIQAYCLDQ